MEHITPLMVLGANTVKVWRRDLRNEFELPAQLFTPVRGI